MTIANTDERLLRLIERIETLETEKKEVADLVKDVYAEAKAVGYDAKILRQIIRKIADDKPFDPPATIDDPSVLVEIREALMTAGIGQMAETQG